jgi:hypothetical protein
MARISVSIVLFSMIVFWNFQVFGQEWTAEQKEVWTSVQANWETFKQGDVEAALAMKHNDMVSWSLSHPEPLRKEHLKQSYINWFNYNKPVSYKLRPLTITIVNNVANVFYLFKWNGNKFSDIGRSFETWVKQDNKWLAIGSLSSSCDNLPRCPHVW